MFGRSNHPPLLVSADTGDGRTPAVNVLPGLALPAGLVEAAPVTDAGEPSAPGFVTAPVAADRELVSVGAVAAPLPAPPAPAVAPSGFLDAPLEPAPVAAVGSDTPPDTDASVDHASVDHASVDHEDASALTSWLAKLAAVRISLPRRTRRDQAAPDADAAEELHDSDSDADVESVHVLPTADDATAVLPVVDPYAPAVAPDVDPSLAFAPPTFAPETPATAEPAVDVLGLPLVLDDPLIDQVPAQTQVQSQVVVDAPPEPSVTGALPAFAAADAAAPVDPAADPTAVDAAPRHDAARPRRTLLAGLRLRRSGPSAAAPVADADLDGEWPRSLVAPVAVTDPTDADPTVVAPAAVAPVAPAPAVEDAAWLRYPPPTVPAVWLDTPPLDTAPADTTLADAPPLEAPAHDVAELGPAASTIPVAVPGFTHLVPPQAGSTEPAAPVPAAEVPDPTQEHTAPVPFATAMHAAAAQAAAQVEAEHSAPMAGLVFADGSRTDLGDGPDGAALQHVADVLTGDAEPTSPNGATAPIE